MTDFEIYFEEYGGNFSKKLYEFAVSMMKDRNGGKPTVMTKDQVTDWLKNYGITLKNDIGYNAAYTLAMARSDYFGSSIKDDNHLALYVRDVLEDVDGNPHAVFDHFVVDCRAKGVPIFWSEMM